MKFLIIMKGVVGASFPEDVLGAWQAAKELTNALLADGTLDCAYVFPDGGGACIANVDSHEELSEKVLAYPFGSRIEWTFCPLADVNHYFDTVIEALQTTGG